MEDERHPWVRIPKPAKTYAAHGSASYFVGPEASATFDEFGSRYGKPRPLDWPRWTRTTYLPANQPCALWV